MKKLIKIATLPNYRPSGFKDCNIVLGEGGLCPTITGQCAHSNAPLILVERAEDEDKDRE